MAARVEEIFPWQVCRVSYRIPRANTPESDGKVMMKSLRIDEVEPLRATDELDHRSVVCVCARARACVCACVLLSQCLA